MPTPTLAHSVASSSNTCRYTSDGWAPPPNPSGYGRLIRPALPSIRMTSRGNISSRSASGARGASSLVATSRARSTRSCASGEGMRRVAGIGAPLRLCSMRFGYCYRYSRRVSGTLPSMAQSLGTPLRNAPVQQRHDRASVRRDELIDELIDLFIRDGFLGFSIEDIARELKRSKTTLYSVADSKEQIFVAVARAFFRRATARIEERLARVDQHNPEQQA